MKSIGDKLRKARKDAALRMVDVQDKTGISIVTVSAIETGKHRNFKADTIQKLIDLYGIDIPLVWKPNPKQ